MRSGFSSLSRHLVFGLLVSSIALCGCHPTNESPYGPGKQRPYIVRVDPTENGAASDNGDSSAAFSRDRPRRLAFKITGEAPHPAGASGAEARVAASQAAIINAFMNALIEARRARGQPTDNFTAHLGPRLTASHRTVEGKAESRITLVHDGRTSRLTVFDNLLQHPPVDIRLIRRIFEETNGEFSLLSTDEMRGETLASATVACYLPSGYPTNAPANVARIDSDEP